MMTDEDTARELWTELSDSFNLMMGARLGKLDTPVTRTISASGDDESECLGSIRHIKEFIEESGYAVDVAEGSKADALNESEVRYQYEITITDE